MIDLQLESVNRLLSLSRGAGFNPHLFTDTNTKRHSHITVYLNEKALQGAFDNLTNATWRVNVQHKACEFEAGENDELHPVSVVASGMIVMTKKKLVDSWGRSFETESSKQTSILTILVA
jgi:hypothetical protein